MSNAEEIAKVIDRLDAAATMAGAIAIELEETRLLAAQDRVQISRLILLVQKLLLGSNRLEETAAHVAEDLAASIIRADDADDQIPGAGADAALRSPNGTAAEVAAADDE